MSEISKRAQVIDNRAMTALSCLVAVVILAVAVYRIAGFEPVGIEKGEIVETRPLIFADGAQGAIIVIDPASEAVITELSAEENGFVRNVLRGFARMRSREGLGGEKPIELVRWSSGHWSVRDPETDWEVEVSSFGPQQTEQFARLMSAGRVS